MTEFIEKQLLGDQQKVSDDQDLLTNGLVDSISVMRLVTFIELETGQQIPPQDVTLENFCTVNAIAQYLKNQIG